MEPKYSQIKVKEQEQSKLNNPNEQLKNIKSDYFIQKIFSYIHERKKLETIKYNKSIQKIIDININNYREYSEKFSSIEIEIIPTKNEYGQFLKIGEDYKKYYHIYFNDNKKEKIKNTYLNEKDIVSKINIIIDYQVESFSCLFESCKCIESINFKKFYRNNINDMCYMFFRCSSLKELNLTNFDTNNVTDMRFMLKLCSSELKTKIKTQCKNIKKEAF